MFSNSYSATSYVADLIQEWKSCDSTFEEDNAWLRPIGTTKFQILSAPQGLASKALKQACLFNIQSMEGIWKCRSNYTQRFC